MEFLFKMGMRMIYFETFYQRNEQWLSGTCITHPLILKSFLAKFYSSYLFYDEYMEKDEDDDVRDENEESDRVKVEKEIKRVWGSYFSLMSDTIAARLCIPERRIVKAMELNTASFKVNDSGYYNLKTPRLNRKPLRRTRRPLRLTQDRPYLSRKLL